MWKELPHIANALGKEAFKYHMDRFLKPLIFTLTRPETHQLAVHAAIECLKSLGEFLGLNVLHEHLINVCGDEVHLNIKEAWNIFPLTWKMPPSPTAAPVQP